MFNSLLFEHANSFQTSQVNFTKKAKQSFILFRHRVDLFVCQLRLNYVKLLSKRTGMKHNIC